MTDPFPFGIITAIYSGFAVVIAAIGAFVFSVERSRSSQPTSIGWLAHRIFRHISRGGFPSPLPLTLGVKFGLGTTIPYPRKTLLRCLSQLARDLVPACLG